MTKIEPVTAEDPLAQSLDSKAETLIALRALVPQAFPEGRLDPDALRELLGGAVLEEGAERYGLNWSGKARARRHALTPTLATLRPAPEDSVDWDSTGNLMIEGDNLEVLKCLAKSYAGKVKVIYIDPPYNTGNDFVYPDDYAEPLRNYLRRTGQAGDDGVRNTSNAESSGRFHSDWLNMIFPRLMLAREMLRKDGIIFVSIDDAEYQRLTLLMAEIFGDDNFIATFIWKRKAGGGDDSGHVAAEHEYVVCWARSSADAELASVLHESPAMTAKYNRQEGGRRYYLERLDKTSLTYSSSMDFPIPAPDGTEVRPPQPDLANPSTAWRWGKKSVKDDYEKLEFLRDKKTGEWRIYTRTWEPLSGVTPRSLMVEKEHGRNRDGSQEVESILGPNVFSNPKPTKMLRHLLNIGAKADDSVVVDFFAGSGSIGHALMDMNASDNGSRRFVLVQLPEILDPANPKQKAGADFCDALGKPRTIAELTKERLRRAGAKVRADNPEARIDTGFRVYKLASSNLKPWNPGADLAADLLDAADNLLPGRTEDDLLAELQLKTGIELTEPAERREIAGKAVHAFGRGSLVVCLADIARQDAGPLADGIADWIIALDPPGKSTIFFRDTGFQDDAAKLNLEAVLRQRLNDRGADLPALLDRVRSL